MVCFNDVSAGPWDHGMLNCTGAGCHGTGMGACSADWVVGLVSDMVLIPKDLKPGHYVLSWRWWVTVAHVASDMVVG